MPGGIDEPILRLSPQEREEVRAALARGTFPLGCANAWREMVKAADMGHDLDEIAVWSGREPRTVRRWLGAFATGGGIEALADAPRSGRPALADVAYLSALERVIETSPRKLRLGSLMCGPPSGLARTWRGRRG